MKVVEGIDCSSQWGTNRVGASEEAEEADSPGIVEDAEKVVTGGDRVGRKSCDSAEGVGRCVSRMPEERGLRGTSYGTKTEADGRAGTVLRERNGR